MFALGEAQNQISSLKKDLQEIGNELVVQRTTALPSLHTENEQQYRETMAALRILRATNSEVEKLKQENVRLLARRMALGQQCAEATASLSAVKQHRDMLMEQLTAADNEQHLIVQKYQDFMLEKANRFRKARVFYIEEEVESEIKKISANNNELYNEMRRVEAQTELLQQKVEARRASVPEDILNILGKDSLTDKLKELTVQRENLEKKLNDLKINKSNEMTL